MNNEASFQQLAAVTSLLATLLALGSSGLQAVVLGINTDPFSHPTSLLGSGANGSTLFRWGMILDIFGSYLLLAPLALLVWSRLKPKGMNLVTFYTFCGLAYRLFTQLWDFRPRDISKGVLLWQGEDDRNVSTSMGRALAAALPHCQATFYPGEGHLSLFLHLAALFDQIPAE